jgi:hypothetical protein
MPAGVGGMDVLGCFVVACAWTETEAGECTPMDEVSRIRHEGRGVYYALDTVSPAQPHRYYGNVYTRSIWDHPKCPNSLELSVMGESESRAYLWTIMPPVTIDEVIPVVDNHWRPLIDFDAPTPSRSPSHGNEEPKSEDSNTASHVSNSVIDWSSPSRLPEVGSIAHTILNSIFPIPPRYVPPPQSD